jgi:hypothetical protein
VTADPFQLKDFVETGLFSRITTAFVAVSHKHLPNFRPANLIFSSLSRNASSLVCRGPQIK